MFFEWALDKVHKLIFARARVKGAPVETKQIADALCNLSMASRGDVLGVLTNLPEVLHTFMAQGRSVRLEGLGIFRFGICGKGVNSLDQVDLEAQKEAVRVRFTPERVKSSNGSYTRALTDTSTLLWVDLTDYTKLEAALAELESSEEAASTEESSTEATSTEGASTEASAGEGSTGEAGAGDSASSEAGTEGTEA